MATSCSLPVSYGGRALFERRRNLFILVAVLVVTAVCPVLKSLVFACLVR